MNKNIDFRIDKKTLVHVTTKTEVGRLYDLLNKLGARWLNGSKYAESYLGNYVKTSVYYHVTQGTICAQDDWKENGYTAISVDDFLKLHPEYGEIIDFKIDLLTVINAETEEEAIELCNFLDELGATWNYDVYNSRYSKYTYWSFHKEATCYNVHDGIYCTKQYAAASGYKIIKVRDFLKLHGVNNSLNKPELEDTTPDHVDLPLNINNLNPKKISMVKDVNQTATETCIKYNIEILL